MALVYLGLAVRDLVKIAQFAVAMGHPDPQTYMSSLRRRLEAMHSNENPGVVGRRPGTMEWILSPTPYVAVIRWAGSDVKIYRVLPSAKMKTPRPGIMGYRPGWE